MRHGCGYEQGGWGDGATLLHFSASHDIVGDLLDRGASLSHRSFNHMTPMQAGCFIKTRSFQQVQTLLRVGVEKELDMGSCVGLDETDVMETPLHLACVVLIERDEEESAWKRVRDEEREWAKAGAPASVAPGGRSGGGGGGGGRQHRHPTKTRHVPGTYHVGFAHDAQSARSRVQVISTLLDLEEPKLGVACNVNAMHSYRALRVPGHRLLQKGYGSIFGDREVRMCWTQARRDHH
eukprot:SAG11_NODE_5197_length_1633_cov_1.258149_3_plen_237_part_00